MQSRMRALMALLCLLTATWLGGCDATDMAEADDATDTTLEVGEEDPEAGKAFFEPAAETGAKEDSASARKGLPVSVDSGSAAVWTVRNQWAETNTAEARKAGLAWAANSGLTWDEKFSAWVQSMPRTSSAYGNSTFTMTTPYGKTLPAPALECAETALFLRATFASWYALPFFVEAADGRTRIFLGHFGFLKEDGTRYSTTPNFKTAYADHSNKADTWQQGGWPKDNALRTRKLGGSQDDYQPALGLGDEARAGTYFDELYLNKRTGYFMVLLLSYFGSVNLADPSNTFNLDPTAIRAGDPLVKRWQRQGIGHVYVTKSVEPLADDRVAAELVSGSMPRRQPVWESAASSQSAYTNDWAGGPGVGWDGDAYATLGGGLKRWRTPVVDGGRWTNIVPVADRAAFVDAGNATAISARIETFRRILGSLSPQERIDTAMEQINAAREHLRRYPASCSARTRREEAFTKLYLVLAEEYGMTASQVDAEYRGLEDYVLAELVYNESKTCCWNSSTSAMYEIIMNKAQAEAALPACVPPTIFKNTAGGYAAFKDHAVSLGRGAEWRDWTADETCPQANTANDVVSPSHATAFCEVRAGITDPGNGPGPVAGGDAFEPNDSRNNAAEVVIDATNNATIARGDVDFYAVSVPNGGTLNIDVGFRHAEGDIDVTVYNERGDKLGSGTSTDDNERVTIGHGTAARFIVEVTLYGNGAGARAQSYTFKAGHVRAGGAQAGGDAYEPNDSAAAAAAINAGRVEGLTHCGDADFFSFSVARAGTSSVRLDFTHAQGDLDLRVLNANGDRVATAAGTTDSELVEKGLPVGAYKIEVIRYGATGGACQPYSLTLRTP